jgi:hypothetical protein
MHKRIFALLFVSALFGILSVSGAAAQVQRTFVSGGGSDLNPCSRTAPCRTFTQALMGTSGGGEVVALDSAGYGAFTITQAVSIIAPPGVYAGISVFSGDGIDINAGGTDTVILRGLTINNQGSLGSGIVFNTGRTLHVENCVVNGFATASASIGINLLAGLGARLEVKDSIIRGNQNGIVVHPTSGTAQGAIDQVRLEENVVEGLSASDGSAVTIRNSLVSGNLEGFRVESTTSANAELDIENCVVSNNSTAITALSFSPGVATVRVSNSTVTHNATGLFQSGPALLLSRGNNTVEGNTTNTFGTIGSYSAK